MAVTPEEFDASRHPERCNFPADMFAVGLEMGEKARREFFDAVLTYFFTGEMTPLKGEAAIGFRASRTRIDAMRDGCMTGGSRVRRGDAP